MNSVIFPAFNHSNSLLTDIEKVTEGHWTEPTRNIWTFQK